MPVHLQILKEVPDSVKVILKTIRSAGYEAYIVGGCVRDILLGREPGDWDITTSALPEQVKSLFSATVDTGIQHGTVMVIMKGCGYEVTTYRIDGEYKDGRHPESVIFTPSLEEDLKRRDFTINAFACDPDEGIIDLFGGLEDLKAGVIRAVGDPRRRFDEDALRIMRAVRFSAQLSFDIEENTRSAIHDYAERLALVSAERIRVEFEKTLYSANPSYVNEYKTLGLSGYIVPDHSEKCFTDNACMMYDNINRMDIKIPGCETKDIYREVLLLAAFFSGMEPDEIHKVMRKMTFDNLRRDFVCGILKFREVVRSGTMPDRGVCAEEDIRLLLRRMGAEIFSLCLYYNEAAGEDMHTGRSIAEQVIARGDAYSVSMLAVSGSDLIKAGASQGPQIGMILEHLLDLVIKDPGSNNREYLLKEAETLFSGS